VKIISEGTGLGLLAGVLGAGILSSDPDPYDYMETVKYPRRENYYDRKNIYELARDERGDRPRLASISYRSQAYPDNVLDLIPKNQSDTERARIYEICNPGAGRTEKMEEDDAFKWWQVESKKQLKGR
jgi:hypothetical protein